MENAYEAAIQRREVDDFFLGRKRYYYHNRDWNEHDHTTTGMFILAYSKNKPCDEFIKQLNSDFKTTLAQPDITSMEFQKILGIILFYFVYHFQEKKAPCVWNIPPDIIESLKKLYWKFRLQGENMAQIESLLTDLITRFNWSDARTITTL